MAGKQSLIKLVEPKTLVAGFTPVLLGSVYSWYEFNKFQLSLFLLAAVGIALTQSATNMINDYFDYKRGADRHARGAEKALVSGETTPAQVIVLILIFELLALGIGIWLGSRSSYGILWIAVIGAIISVAYASGPIPISYLPIGELVSGATMGIGITATVIFIQSGVVNTKTILITLPTMLYVATVLLSNNLSDMKEDQEAGRRTLPLLIGYKWAERLLIVNVSSIYLLTVGYALVGVYPIIMLPFAVMFFPVMEIYKFKTYSKNVGTKGATIGLIGKIGIKYHAGIVLVLLGMIALR